MNDEDELSPQDKALEALRKMREPAEPEETLKQKRQTKLYNKKMQVLNDMERKLHVQESLMNLADVCEKNDGITEFLTEYLTALRILSTGRADRFEVEINIEESKSDSTLNYTRIFRFWKHGKPIDFSTFSDIIKG